MAKDEEAGFLPGWGVWASPPSQPLPWDFQAGVGREGQREKDRREAHCLCGQQHIKDKIWGQAGSSW